MTARITRDAFLFLTPKSDSQEKDFAQCGPCRMFVPERFLAGKLNGDRCIIHGSDTRLGEEWSCGFFVAWPTKDGSPVEHVVRDHANELIKPGGLQASVTPKESGLVSRLVQCQRCCFADDDVDKCELYEDLNQKMPDVFDLDTKITPHSCCNAQEPKAGKSGGGFMDAIRKRKAKK